jgi:hypothetical protein
MVEGMYRILIVFLIAFVPQLLSAQSAQVSSMDIAKRYPLLETAFVFGDVVVYDRETQIYRLSFKRADTDVLGVTVENPTFLLDDGTENTPVVRTGETRVNVVGTGGPIAVGDYLTTSAVSGKAERASPSDSYLLGIALGSYAGFPEEVTGEQAGIGYGQIPVLLAVGHISKAQEISTGKTADSGVTEATVLNVIQYIVAAFVAVGSVYIAFRNFGPNLKEGVVSMGRNPLAKASIQSMVVLNVVLIVLISGAGLLVGLAILLLPI